jgi:hypothetical protein
MRLAAGRADDPTATSRARSKKPCAVRRTTRPTVPRIRPLSDGRDLRSSSELRLPAKTQTRSTTRSIAWFFVPKCPSVRFSVLYAGLGAEDAGEGSAISGMPSNDGG